MKKVTNTGKKEKNIDWLFGGNPGAIEAQEAKGQSELVASSQLPRKCNEPFHTNATEQYHKMGIKTFTTSKGDDLFIGVSLPKGWEIKPTDHSMWNNLVDDKGRIRATIFYKAAFYDRESFINFEKRYSHTQEYVDIKNRESYEKYYCVKDNAKEEIIFKTDATKEYLDKNLRNLCIKYLNTNCPEWENINAYWD